MVSSLSDLLKLFRTIFEEPGCVSAAASALLCLRQESASVGQYALQFRILTAELSWNNEALVATFLHGLSDRVKDELAGRSLPADLDGVITLCNQIDICFQERVLEKRRQHSPFLRQLELPVPSLRSEEHPLPVEEPMQLGWTKLSPEERTRCRTLGLCLYCGAKGHFRETCSLHPEKRSGLIHLDGGVLDSEVSPSPSRLLLSVFFHAGASSHSVSAHLDSGAAGNFMDWETASSMRLTLLPLSTPLVVLAIDGTVLPGGPIRFQTLPVKMSVGTLHQECIAFLVLPKASSPIILGLPWLRFHSSHIDWTAGRILAWGSSCSSSCLLKVTPKEKLPVATIPVSSALPAAYSDFWNVSCNSRAEALPGSCGTLDEEPTCELEPIIHSSLHGHLPFPVPGAPWTHTQADSSTSSTVATPCDAILVVAAPGDAVQSVSAPVQPMPSEAIQLDFCDTSFSNQPGLRDPLTSAHSDDPVLDVQLIFKGLGDPAQTPDGLLMPLPIPKKPLARNKSSHPLPTSVSVSEDNLKYKISQVLHLPVP